MHNPHTRQGDYDVITLPSQAHLKRLKRQPILGVKRTKTKYSWGTREGKQPIRSLSVGYQSRWYTDLDGKKYVLRVIDRYVVKSYSVNSRPIYVAQIIDNQLKFLIDPPKDRALIEQIDLFFGIWKDDNQRNNTHVKRVTLVKGCTSAKHLHQRNRHNRTKSRQRLGKRERQAKKEAINLVSQSDNFVFRFPLLKSTLEGQNVH